MLIRSKNLGRNFQNGAVAIIVALSLPVLIGMAGLALDLGKLYVTKTELQNASDACALAAAVELDGTVTQFIIAESKGIVVGKLNKSYFQSVELLDDLNVTRIVEFATSLNGTYLSKTAATSSGSPANYKFVKCSTTRKNIPNYLIPVLNIFTPKQGNDNKISTVNAVAVASNRPGQGSCSLPIGICSADVPSSKPVGSWLEGTLSGGNGINGAYKWVDFSAPSGGANELSNILNGKNPQDCNLKPMGEDVKESGAKASLRDDYNTRFGIEKGAATGIPDFSGYSYYVTNWATKFGAYSDFAAKRLNNTPFQGESQSGVELAGNPSILTMNQLAIRGSDRRVAVAPVVDCNLFATANASVPVQRYVCVFLLHPMQTQGTQNFKMYLEYLGNAANAGPCNQSGIAGASNGIGPRVSALVQ